MLKEIKLHGDSANSTLSICSKIKSSKQNLKKTDKLVWNVLVESGFGINSNLGYINIFEYNWPFRAYLYEAYREFKDDFDNFSKSVCSAVFHEYWSRCEYEIIISPWPTSLDETEINRLNADLVERRSKNPESKNIFVYPNIDKAEKIDVADQIMMNWNTFINYLWENRNLLKKFKQDYCQLYHKKDWYPSKTNKKVK